jgi:hypothetical protein
MRSRGSVPGVPLGQDSTAALDSAFSGDTDEIIERVLLVYRPILSHAVMATFRRNLFLVAHTIDFAPWRPEGPRPPVHGIGALTAGQVALLGGTRPRRILHTLVTDLDVALDGDKASLERAHNVLLPTSDAVESLAAYHDVVPVKGWEAGARKMRAFVDLAVATQIAAAMGALHEEHPWSRQRERRQAPEFVRRYFLGLVEVFGQIKLPRKDEAIFRDHYLEDVTIEQLAEEKGRGLDAEVERRLGFLRRLAKALKLEIGKRTGVAGPGTVDEPRVLGGTDAAVPPALTQAVGRGAPPRTR